MNAAVSPAHGRITCCGITRHIPSTLFAYQAGEKIVKVNGIEGPHHPELGIAMDMSIQMKTESGKICTLSLSFNNDGPLGTFFRYICDTAPISPVTMILWTVARIRLTSPMSTFR